AAFGRGAETVLDKSYRDARTVDSGGFDLGRTLQAACAEIVRTLSHVLPPRNRFDRGDFAVPVPAELYRINAYGPGGFFRPHRDTPRGATMFGSLVVCLPVAFAGGQLVVRHGGRQVVHDWAERSGVSAGGGGPLLQWAAFFSDCEHEILPVTDGLRVTLTFNLHRIVDPSEEDEDEEGAAKMREEPPSVDVPGSSVEAFLRQLLADPLFMPDGGRLGFALSHEYSKTVGGDLNVTLFDLKGEDFLLASAAKSAGLEAQVVAIYEADWETWMCFDGKVRGSGPKDVAPNKYNFGNSVRDLRVHEHGDMDGKALLVAQNFEAGCGNNGQEERKLYEILTDDAGCEVWGDVVWVRRPESFTIHASTYIAYGNDATQKNIYTAAALVVQVPGQRNPNKRRKKRKNRKWTLTENKRNRKRCGA
ncbi:hypothetical protein DFJ73DRAFT_621631, partial [Zopfochytrium polystomum]